MGKLNKKIIFQALDDIASGSQSESLGPAAAVVESPGNLLIIQNLRAHLPLAEQKLWEWVSAICVLTSFPDDSGKG